MCSVTRRDMESTFQRFWRYEQMNMQLHPIDNSQPRLGGKVHASSYVFDVRRFTFSKKEYFGVYGEDFINFGEFSSGNVLDNEEALLKVCDGDLVDEVLDRHSFRFENDRLYYGREVNAETNDTEVEHAIEQSELTPSVAQSWSETLFYGIGNKDM